MRTARMLEVCLAALASLTFLGGCQRGAAPLNPVSGKIAYKGLFLQGGTIVFIPDKSRGESGPIVFGRINQEGIYRLYTAEAFGAAAGRYRVTVSSMASSPLQTAGQPFTLAASFLPEKYRDPELSKLACEVKANQANTIDFNLD